MSGVTPKSIIDVIQCELIQTRPYFGGWTAVADLTLQVTEQLTLAPAFSHTDVVSKSFSKVFDWGVKFDSQATRIYSETVAFDIDQLVTSKWCAHRMLEGTQGISLNGNLGLVEVVKMGLNSVDDEDKGVSIFDEERSDAVKKKAAFGTSVEFQVVKGLHAAGPTWTLGYFRGPGKLFSTQRNDAHKLTISFSKKKGGGQGAQAAAVQNQKINIEGLSTAIKQMKAP